MSRIRKPQTAGGIVRLLAAIFAGVAVLLLVIAGGLMLNTRSFLVDSNTADGAASRGRR